MNERDKQILYHIRKNCSKIMDIEKTKDEEIKNLEDDSDSEDVSNIGL